MSECPQCHAASIGALPLCLSCGHGAGRPRRVRRRLSLTEIDTREQGRLLTALRALDAEPFSLVEAVVEGGSFDLEVPLSDLEQGRLEQALTTLGVRFHAANDGPSAGRYEVRWGVDLALGAKLLFTTSAFVAAQYLDASLVSTAGAFTLGALLLRTARVLPRELGCSEGAVGRHLGVISDELLEQLTAARPVLERRRRLDALRPSLEHFVALASLLRGNGALLVRPELVRIDQNLHELMRQVLRDAASDEAMPPDSDLLARLLPEVERRLGSFVELLSAHRHQARGTTVGAPLSVLAELQAGIDQVAVLASAPARAAVA